MKNKRLIEIIQTTTMGLRKQEKMITQKVDSGINIITINHEVRPQDIDLTGMVQVDVHFFIVGVHKDQACKHKAELEAILDDWPEPLMLEGGPSFIAMGGMLGDQEMALRLYGLGEALGFWKVITPERLGITGELAEVSAGNGLVMMTGYKGGMQHEPAE